MSWFAEKAEPALGAIRANLKALKITHGFIGRRARHSARCSNASHEECAEIIPPPMRASSRHRPELLDLVYLDPPWEAEAEYTNTLHLLGSARGRQLLAPGALVVAEHNSKSQLAPALRRTHSDPHSQTRRRRAYLLFLVITSEPGYAWQG